MDVETVRAGQRGDVAAIAALVDDFMPTVLGTAYGYCGDWDEAADVAQETFAIMLERLSELREPRALPGWLMAVVRSSARRQRQRRQPVALTSVALDVEETVISSDEARRTRLAVEALPTELRLPMVLHYFAGCNVADVADLLGVPMSTIKKRMRVARARLHSEMEVMATSIEDRMRADPGSDPTDVIRLYTAMRSGDVRWVSTILDARPDLVDARENWTRAEGVAHGLTGGDGGTPLLRAVERGDLRMVQLLLRRGADANRSCSCRGGETPLWVAVVQHEVEIVIALIAHGARTDVAAFAGLTAIEVARLRGYNDLIAVLDDEHEGESESRTMAAVVEPSATGIRAIDLWCPLPARGLIHLRPGYGSGALVMIAELSYRFAKKGRTVVWTGVAPAPTDLGDLHHVLAESDLVGDVLTSIAPVSAEPDVRVRALERGLELVSEGCFAVVFAETGYVHLIEQHLPLLASRDAVVLIVAPFIEPGEPIKPTGTPYLASIEFDADRARRGHWPAVSEKSWSKACDPETQLLADAARNARTNELDQYLSQPFYIAEPITGLPGESTPLTTLRTDITQLLAPASAAAATF